MYSQQLQNRIEDISAVSDVNPADVKLLDRSLAAYMMVLAHYLGAGLNSHTDLLSVSIDSLLISSGLSKLDLSPAIESGHYLVGMAFEQSGELLARKMLASGSELEEPQKNDMWYRLLLSFLHYLVGGHSIQAKGVLEQLSQFKDREVGNPHRIEYQNAHEALRRLLDGKMPRDPYNRWEELLFGHPQLTNLQEEKINRLATVTRLRRLAALEELGAGNEAEWLELQGIRDQQAIDFWRIYLQRLENRGYTNFTNDQRGRDGFTSWLIDQSDLLVILPTGAGKTIIGELKTALALATGKQVLWLLPTRALVRQSKYELRIAFEPLGVEVEELPVTEDFDPYLLENIPGNRFVSATTPEKFLSLMRVSEHAIDKVGLVIVDEAQKLFDVSRGTSIEFVLQEIRRLLPECNFVFMSAQIDALEKFRGFLGRLRGMEEYSELTSDNRPTRRIYGVITNETVNGYWYPNIQVYPPGLQTVDGETDNPFSIIISKKRNRVRVRNLVLAQRASVEFTKTQLRSVLFVDRPVSTEKQADVISRAIGTRNNLPEDDLARLDIELGRESVVSQYGIKGVSPHHAGLTPLEQHIAEKWTKDKRIQTIVATSTLAEGVNLPFDVSIVSFIRRYRGGGADEDVPIIEIQNMLGRAGRAGKVSDGLCLLALPFQRGQRSTLDRARRYFFHKERITDLLGLSRLLDKSQHANIGNRDWLYEYSGLSFSECQTIVSFILKVGLDLENLEEELSNRLALFPSIQDFENIPQLLNDYLIPLATNIREITGGDEIILDAMSRTGLPFEILQFFINRMDQIQGIRFQDDAEKFQWADNNVHAALDTCRNRDWFIKLFKGINIENMILAIQLWRNGSQMIEIERAWNIGRYESEKRIKIGQFFNQKLSLIAQFWGGLSISEKILFPDQRSLQLENIQVFTREGVNSISELSWLNRLGNIDRVLAHHLARYTPPDIEPREIGNEVKQLIASWRRDRGTWPLDLGLSELAAINSIFSEQQSD